MVILGIDPGYGRIGFGVIQKVGNTFSMIDYGVIYTDKDANLPKRLLKIKKDMKSLIDRYKPDESAVEELYFFKNVATAIQVGEARGVILVSLEEENIPIFEYTPFQIKQAVTGYGRAEKGQIQRALKLILKLEKTPTPDDASDALAAAFCHANFRRNFKNARY
ncbi:crossover junction endodeoxyribonuclease RuvC [Petrotoga sp. 9PWA.NaAc.5.4]|uniref:crossover junction endodeoxyribonuclease RuvC n=1 Tax=Petrotoga sp. 9PWA.NaAc.5.4 TaxID=1434328 RepID=UPI000CB61CC5|nr:crossover junction endodeoxyribonuclease RuvC [Petrotoga sp. 9PWA.NaAc.5.4]PNR93664.1 Holliday junction resolvase [Petrotoga sp. 9PWA.NaAc.5.4]